jgi:menaquinone-dependent protoporphyrinogen oxidase
MMKPVAVLYATREGQTKRIAEHTAGAMGARGFDVDVKDLRDDSGSVDLNRYAAAILAASVHLGKHEREMVKFVKDHLTELERLPSAFLSVTLSEAGAEKPDATPEERARHSAGVREVMEKFFVDTGWRPQRVKPVAGALLYSKYNPLVRFVMKRIARKAGTGTDTSRDYEYTDWVSLDRFVDELAEDLAASAPQTSR